MFCWIPHMWSWTCHPGISCLNQVGIHPTSCASHRHSEDGPSIGDIHQNSPVTPVPVTIGLLHYYFWCPSLNKDIIEYVSSCPFCNGNKTIHNLPAGLLQSLSIPSRPRSHIAFDFVTRLPTSKGKNIILTIIYHFSKADHLVALTKLPSSSKTAIFHPHVIPAEIVSDP